MTNFNQKGSTAIIAIVGVLVIAIGGFVGYRVLNASSPEASSNTPVASQTAAPNKIETKADIQKASNALDQTAIDGSVNPEQLNDDINSL